MKFKPFTKKYKFEEKVLIEDFPEYFFKPISEWLYSIMNYNGVLEGGRRLITFFNNELNVMFRENFPAEWGEFLEFIFNDNERLCDILALCLQNFANEEEALDLEFILSQGGSAYSIIKTDKSANEYKKGVYNLAFRVPDLVKKQAEKALSKNQLLEEAWSFCYSRKPDYEKTVTRCCDFLEGYLGKKYFPADPKPQLVKFIHSLKGAKSKTLNYKGNTIVEPPNLILDLLENASNVRGQHTRGQGRKPTKEEAEFILQTTIYIWNLHEV